MFEVRAEKTSRVARRLGVYGGGWGHGVGMMSDRRHRPRRGGAELPGNLEPLYSGAQVARIYERGMPCGAPTLVFATWILLRESARAVGRPPDGPAAALLALAGHGIFCWLMLFLSLLQLRCPRCSGSRPRARWCRGLSNEQWAQNRASCEGERRAERARHPKKAASRSPTPRGAQGPGGGGRPGQRPEDPNAAFVSERLTNKVQKQTKAKETSPFYRNAMPKRTSSNPQEGNGSDSVDKRRSRATTASGRRSAAARGGTEGDNRGA